MSNHKYTTTLLILSGLRSKGTTIAMLKEVQCYYNGMAGKVSGMIIRYQGDDGLSKKSVAMVNEIYLLPRTTTTNGDL